MVDRSELKLSPSRYYTVEEVAKMLGYSRGTVKSYINLGYLKAAMIGHLWIVGCADLKKFLEQGTAGIARRRREKIIAGHSMGSPTGQPKHPGKSPNGE